MGEFGSEYIVNNKISSYLTCCEEIRDEANGVLYAGSIDNCGKKYNLKSNAIRHIHLIHKNEFDAIRKNKATQQDRNDNTLENIELRVRVNVEDIWNAC